MEGRPLVDRQARHHAWRQPRKLSSLQPALDMAHLGRAQLGVQEERGGRCRLFHGFGTEVAMRVAENICLSAPSSQFSD